MATHSNTLAWKIPWTEKPGRLQSMWSQRVGHNWATSLHFTSEGPYPTLVTVHCSVTQSCWLCNSMDCSMPGFPVLHYLPEFAQTHVHWVSDAIQPSHPLLSPSSSALNLSQHQGLFQWVGSFYQVVKVLHGSGRSLHVGASPSYDVRAGEGKEFVKYHHGPNEPQRGFQRY